MLHPLVKYDVKRQHFQVQNLSDAQSKQQVVY